MITARSCRSRPLLTMGIALMDGLARGTEDALGTETTVTLNESHMATVTFVKVWGLEVAAGDGG